MGRGRPQSRSNASNAVHGNTQNHVRARSLIAPFTDSGGRRVDDLHPGVARKAAEESEAQGRSHDAALFKCLAYRIEELMSEQSLAYTELEMAHAALRVLVLAVEEEGKAISQSPKGTAKRLKESALDWARGIIDDS